MERNVIKRPFCLFQQYRNARYDSAVPCWNQTYYVRGTILRAQEVKQIAQHASRGAPNVEALVRHGVERAPPAGQFHRQALVVQAIHQESSGTSKISATSDGSARSANGGVTRPTTGVTW